MPRGRDATLRQLVVDQCFAVAFAVVLHTHVFLGQCQFLHPHSIVVTPIVLTPLTPLSPVSDIFIFIFRPP